jgi:hypothetical protein
MNIKDYPFLRDARKISNDICIDGVPLRKSSRLCMRPILGAFVDRRGEQPFIIGVYVGRRSPKSISEFMKDFVSEVQSINVDGLVIEDRKVDFEIRAYCCDVPTRFFLASVKYPTSYDGCTKCCQRVENSTSGKLHCTLAGTRFATLSIIRNQEVIQSRNWERTWSSNSS